MRKILFVMFAALAFVACNEKSDEYIVPPAEVQIEWDSSKYFTKDSDVGGIKLRAMEVSNGDKTTFTASCDAYIAKILFYDLDGNEFSYRFGRDDMELDFEIGVVKRSNPHTFDLEIFPTIDYSCIMLLVAPIDAKVHSTALTIYFSKFLEEELKNVN